VFAGEQRQLTAAPEQPTTGTEDSREGQQPVFLDQPLIRQLGRDRHAADHHDAGGGDLASYPRGQRRKQHLAALRERGRTLNVG